MACRWDAGSCLAAPTPRSSEEGLAASLGILSVKSEKKHVPLRALWGGAALVFQANLVECVPGFPGFGVQGSVVLPWFSFFSVSQKKNI